MAFRMYFRGICAFLLLALLLAAVPPLSAQESPDDPVIDLMSRMSPEAKVGQLVLVTFPGTDIAENSPILSLIQDYGIGGVLLRPQNGNLTGVLASAEMGDAAASGEPAKLAAGELVSITNALQVAAWNAAGTVPAASDDESVLPFGSTYVPLLIGIQSMDSGIAPLTLITSTSPMPTLMALGATWDPSLSEQVGAVLGRELGALGINLYLGPDLDVLYTPRPGDPADLGTRVFGGDPFWVGEMGAAYIRGLHEGSEGRLLVVPRHLPGLGSADRPLADEVPTVQKPLEMLKQIELVPFFAAARDLPRSAAAADGFLVTHIRYRGFQGNNIRQTTRPISLDATALKLVMGLDEIAPWRSGGGLLIADNLGLQSVRLSYDPRGLTFNARRVAQDALSAGNDLLILDHFGSPDSWDVHFTNVRDTLMFLASRYKDEPAFQSLVDAAVYRILSMKLGLYSRRHVDAVTIDPVETASRLSGGELVDTQVARSALTLVFPLTEDLLPSSPREGETIVVFTQADGVSGGEAQSAARPDVANPVTSMAPDAIASTILRFYGPDGAGVVRADAVQSFTFADLLFAIQNAGATDADGVPLLVPFTVNRALSGADWIVFAATGLDRTREEAQVLKQFLASQANLYDAQLAVLAFGPPYELDSTEISKLDAYYALYSTGEAFVEAGVRALFRDLIAPGNPPVDVPALNYHMSQVTMPNPEQTIGLFVVNDAGEELTQTERVSIHIGDMINLRTGIIQDRNDRVVPDGTPVQFVLTYPQEGIQQTIASETVDGVARTSVMLDRAGQLNISVQSEPALSSVRLELVSRDDGVTITEVEPTPTQTPTQTPTPTPEPTSTPTPVPIPGKTTELPNPLKLPAPDTGKLLRWGLLGALAVAGFGFVWSRHLSMKADLAIRVALLGLISGLVGYDLFVGLGRWWLPMVWYALVAREYLVGLVTIGIGSLGLLIALWTMQDRSRFDLNAAASADRQYLESRA